jgi:DNA-binding MarR family transcriptional regulator
MIDVSPGDFLKLYGGMVRALRAIEKAGNKGKISPSGLPTRKLSEEIFNSRTYGWKVLKQAEKLGYIKRKKVRRPKGQKGNYMVMNYLTPKGRRLLQELD